jgi:hypothetical protein
MFRFNKMLYYETVAYLSLCQLSQMYNSSSLCVCVKGPMKTKVPTATKVIMQLCCQFSIMPRSECCNISFS